MIKVLYIVSFTLLIHFYSFAQFSLNTEYAYLKAINQGENKELIENSIYSSECFIEEIIMLNNDTSLYSDFFIELALSYSHLEDYDNMFFSILRQRCVFPSECSDENSLKLLKESVNYLNLDEKALDEIIKQTQIALTEETKRESIEKLFLFIIKSGINQEKKANKYLFLLNKHDHKVAVFWLRQWLFYQEINVKNKKIKELVSFDKKQGEEIEFFTIHESKTRKLLYFKAIKYYYNIGMYEKTLSLLDALEKEELEKKEKSQLKKTQAKINRKLNKDLELF